MGRLSSLVRSRRRLLALGLIALGLLLVALPVAYFSYAAVARSQAHKVEASLSPDEYQAWAIRPSAEVQPPSPPPGYSGELKVNDYSADGYADRSVPYAYAQQRLPNGLYGWQLLDLIGSADRMVAPTTVGDEAAVVPTPVPHLLTPEEALSPGDLAALRRAQPAASDDTAAQRIRIPSIGVDSGVREIRPVVEEGKLVWERPNKIVGQLAGTPNPGRGGNTVMAGHLESPVRGEGNVFENLANVRLLEPVYVQTERALYEYRIVQKLIVDPADLNILDSTDDATLTLITCTPRWDNYSRRLIVTGKLFKVSDLPPAVTSGAN